jgi:uncharacterized LabA/DUF88 family protein
MEEKKNEEINEKNRKLKNYEIIISIWRRMDESYWTSVNIFILIIGLLLAGYSQIIDIANIAKPLLYVYCIAAILISLIWLFVLHKKKAFVYLAEEVGRELEETMYSDLAKVERDLEKTKDSDLHKVGFFTRSKEIFKNGDEKMLNEFLKRRKIFTKVRSAFLMCFILPTVMIVIWICILIVTWRCI